MMYSEFIERTDYTESYMTYSDYSNYIEPVYMYLDIDKNTFCKKFRKDFFNAVQKPVEMLITAKTDEELDEYVFSGNKDVMNDVEEIEKTLKAAFLKTYLKMTKRAA